MKHAFRAMAAAPSPAASLAHPDAPFANRADVGRVGAIAASGQGFLNRDGKTEAPFALLEELGMDVFLARRYERRFRFRLTRQST